MLLLFPCPGTIPVPSCRLSCQTSCCVPPSSGCAVVASSRLSTAPTTAPYAVLRRGPHSYNIRVGSRDEIVSVGRLKAYTEADATPGSPPHCGQPPGKHSGSPATTKRVSFSDPLVSSPSPSQAPPSDGPGTIFPVADWFFALPWTSGVIPVSKAAVPAPSAVTASGIGPLTFPPAGPCQSSGGALWRPGYTPG